MKRILNKQDIIEILYGVTLLASGGGGPLKLGLRIVEELDKKNSIKLNLWDVDDMEDDAYGAMSACLGSPVAMEKANFDFTDCSNAYLGFRDEMKRSGKDLKYIFSGEFGGMNTAIAIYTAIVTNTPMIDLDTNMRAVPELNTGVLPNRGKPAHPIVLSNTNGDVVVAYAKDPTDSTATETIARALCMPYGMKIGFSTWALNKKEINELLTPGSLSYAQKAGKALLDARSNKGDIFKAISSVITCKELGRGRIENVELAQKNGFDYGITTICIEDGKLIIDFKNEHMIVRDENGKAIITVPDTVCIVDVDSYEPLTNDRVKEGLNVIVMAVPAAKMWDFPEGFGCFRHILKSVGYEGEIVKF